MSVGIDEPVDEEAGETMKRDQVIIGVAVPVSLVLVAFGAFSVVGAYTAQNLWAGLPVFIAGVALLAYCLKIPERSRELYAELREGSRQRWIQFALGTAASLVVIAGAIISYKSSASSSPETAEAGMVQFISALCWWLIPAIALRMGGNAIGEYPKNGHALWTFGFLTVSWIAMVLLMFAPLAAAGYVSGTMSADAMIAQIRFSLISVLLLAALLANMLYRRPSRPFE
jgi:uncharacterized membrane protein